MRIASVVAEASQRGHTALSSRQHCNSPRHPLGGRASQDKLGLSVRIYDFKTGQSPLPALQPAPRETVTVQLLKIALRTIASPPNGQVDNQFVALPRRTNSVRAAQGWPNHSFVGEQNTRARLAVVLLPRDACRQWRSLGSGRSLE